MRSGIAPLLVVAACHGATRPAKEPPPARAPAASAAAAPAPLAVGVCAPEVKDVRPCELDCDRGIATACAELAERYETGRYETPDAGRDARKSPLLLTRAVALHERACQLRVASECLAAARMHAAGRGVLPSRTRQIELLVAGCELGEVGACNTAARAYETGGGVPKDESRARLLWQRACLNGDAEACGDD